MRILNPNCYCKSCINQWSCKDHKLVVRLQGLLCSLGDNNISVMMKVYDCDKIEEFENDNKK